MLDSGKKFALSATKKINILTLVLSEIFFLNETKNHNPSPPFQVKWSVPYALYVLAFMIYLFIIYVLCCMCYFQICFVYCVFYAPCEVNQNYFFWVCGTVWMRLPNVHGIYRSTLYLIFCLDNISIYNLINNFTCSYLCPLYPS
jgi:hypothetical protein